MKRKKKFAVTLIEIMIVILLIGMITGALAFNMSGSMDKGRAFKTEQNIARVYDILLLEQASSDKTVADIVKTWDKIVEASPLVLHKGSELMKDGWRQTLQVTNKKGEIVIISEKLKEYKTKHGS